MIKSFLIRFDNYDFTKVDGNESLKLLKYILSISLTNFMKLFISDCINKQDFDFIIARIQTLKIVF